MLDYRKVSLGAAIPLVDVVSGARPVLHTLSVSTAVLALVMLATIGRRLLRRSWIGVPIGMLGHLALDLIAPAPALLWFPFWGELTASDLPELDLTGVRLLLEIAAIAIAIYATKRFDLRDDTNKSRFVRSGRLPANSFR